MNVRVSSSMFVDENLGEVDWTGWNAPSPLVGLESQSTSIVVHTTGGGGTGVDSTELGRAGCRRLEAGGWDKEKLRGNLA